MGPELTQTTTCCLSAALTLPAVERRSPRQRFTSCSLGSRRPRWLWLPSGRNSWGTGRKKRLGVTTGTAPAPTKSQPGSPNPQSSPRPPQTFGHPKTKPQTHSTGFVLPQEPLAFLHELDVLVVPLPGVFYQLQTLQQEILLLFQLLHVLQLQDRAHRDVKPQELVSS